MEGSTSEEGHNAQSWIESHQYFMIWSLLQLTLIHNLDVNSNKRRSIIAAPAPFEENRWPRWIHHLRVLHLPASRVEPSLISIKCFDGSYKPLNHFLPLWSKAKKGALIVLGVWTPGGQLLAHTDITSCLSRRGSGHMCQRPAGWLWSWPPTARLLSSPEVRYEWSFPRVRYKWRP